MGWIFKSKVCGHFDTLSRSDHPSTEQLQPSQFWKLGVLKHKMAAKGLVCPQFFCQKNKLAYFCESFKKCNDRNLCDLKLLSYGIIFLFYPFQILSIAKFNMTLLKRGCEGPCYFQGKVTINPITTIISSSCVISSLFWCLNSRLWPWNLAGHNGPVPSV